jgi:hypothetical protein
MGVFTNAEMEVVLVLPDAAAERAGMQVGDILVDVRLAQIAPGESGDPVSFSNVVVAKELTSKGIPNGCCGGGRSVRLNVQRGDQIIELYITPGFSRANRANVVQLNRELSPIATPTSIPTATPAPSGWLYF